MSIYLTAYIPLLCQIDPPDTLNLNRQDKNPAQSVSAVGGPIYLSRILAKDQVLKRNYCRYWEDSASITRYNPLENYLTKRKEF